MGWRVIGAFVLSIGLVASVGPTADAGDDAKPFPVGRSQILKSGGKYYVEGRVRIAKGVDIMVSKETTIVGRGEGGGIIEVEGQLAIVGVSNLHVFLTDVTIELQPKFTSFRTDMVDFGGSSLGVRSAGDAPVDGRLFLQNTTFGGKSTVDVTFSSNEVDLQRIDAPNLVRVKAVTPAGQDANRVKLNLMNNCGGTSGPVSGRLSGGLLVENVSEVIVRTNVLGGESVRFVDCGPIDFDANHVTCKTLEFVQAAAGRFKGTTITKCDVQCQKIVLSAPADPKKPDKVVCDKCWFGGETKEKLVREKYFTDKDDDPNCGVAVDIQKISEKPMELAGVVTK
jgi:hypothetical protein